MKGESKHINPADVIEAFWGYKFILFKCPAAQVFPMLFKNNISVIDNLLDYRRMDLIGKQNSLIDNQNRLLKEIHTVERGILYLTFVVIVDVVFTILSELVVDWQIEHSYKVLTNLTLALVFLCLYYKVLAPVANTS